MVIDQAVRNRIGKSVTNRLGIAMEQGEIEAKDIKNVCGLILPVIDEISSYEQLQQLFHTLSASWPFFAEVLPKEQNVTYVGSASA